MKNAEAARAAEQTRAQTPLNYFNYFTEIEEAFVRRRGKHLLVSPLDWSLMESWKKLGIPLHVVLRGIEKSFDSYESKPRNRSVKTLYYCQEEVEAQFKEWLESQTGAHAKSETTEDGARDSSVEVVAGSDEGAGRGLPFPRPVISAHLSECRDEIRRALQERERAGDEALREALGRAASRLEELASDFERSTNPNAEALENSLADIEALLDRALRESLPPESLEEARAEAAEQLKPYRARMERATYEQTLENLLAKSLRERARVPRLSLFYL
ncbi:MAG TPA: hypothetical protein VGP08_06890 [Pyrinomonadaceae bacterium]|jgi:hypothetical protein|nr:hypothetical protein [Pyrinomonadaceae bacterium]